jgi:protein-tyrosine-phosphatase
MNVLFLCTGNSARSIMAEAILNRLGGGRCRAYSAGSRPKGEVHPESLRLLDQLGHDTSALRSKSWEEFGKPDAPRFDVIITVCDDAAGEACPLWPGKPTTAHWGIPDPAKAAGTDVTRAFADAYRRLYQRIEAFASLPISELSPESLRSKLRDIAHMEGATDKAKASQ